MLQASTAESRTSSSAVCVATAACARSELVMQNGRDSVQLVLVRGVIAFYGRGPHKVYFGER